MACSGVGSSFAGSSFADFSAGAGAGFSCGFFSGAGFGSFFSCAFGAAGFSSAGAGSSVGYAWRLARRWSFSLEGGLGIYYMDDTRWPPRPSPVEDVLLRHYRRVVLAPAKMEVSFSYVF